MKWWNWLIVITLTVGAGVLFGTSDMGGFAAFFLTLAIFIVSISIFVLVNKNRENDIKNGLHKMSSEQLYDRAIYLINKKRTKEEDEELEEINSIVRERDEPDDNSNI